MIANNVKKLRSSKGITQRRLADLAGTSQQQVQRIEAGVQAARIDLAERLAVALGTSLPSLFPELAKVKIRQLRSLSEEEAELVAQAGIELDPNLYTFRVRLQGGVERDFIVSARDKGRLRRLVLEWDRGHMAVFDTPTERVAINLKAMSFCQFLFDPLFSPAMEEGEAKEEGEAREDDDGGGLKLWLAEGGETLHFGVDFDYQTEDEEELGNLAGLFYDLEIADEDDHPVRFVDEDGEEAVLLPSHISLCTVPLRFVSRDLLDAEMDGEEEEDGEEKS